MLISFNKSIHLGTGKTRTLVAAVDEIIHLSKKNHVLICANSNAACDEIAIRLLQVVDKNQMLRMYAKSYHEKNVNEQIKNCSNYIKGKFSIPCLKYLYTFRIVICTLLTSGCVSRACEERDFEPGHFSHIIIDEAASSNETATLIPIAGIIYP